MNSYLWIHKKEVQTDKSFLAEIKSAFYSELDNLTKSIKDKNYFYLLFSILSAPPFLLKEEIEKIIICIKKQKNEMSRYNEFTKPMISLMNENFLENQVFFEPILNELILPLQEKPEIFNFQSKLKILMQMASINYKNFTYIDILISVTILVVIKIMNL